MHNLREILKKINIADPVLFDEPMKNHTSFRIGGPADVFIKPSTLRSLITIISLCREYNIPFFLLGKGANILVADTGVRGIVISFSSLSSVRFEDKKIIAEAGADVTTVALAAYETGLAGLEFLYSMPGSIGGALWMNARCYGREIGDVVVSAEILDKKNKSVSIPLTGKDFSYKKSPFRDNNDIILSATFLLKKGEKKAMKDRMDYYKNDREKKGHFLFPSAGSIFKNNTDFGRSTGKIIDSLHLKGYSIGDACVSPYHGNIIVNQGNAKASDVLELIIFIEKAVKRELDLELEREVLLVGEWKEERNE